MYYNLTRSHKQPNKTTSQGGKHNMKMKKYMIYLDDGRDCYKLAIPAKDEKAAREYVQGNGEVIAVKEVTND